MSLRNSGNRLGALTKDLLAQWEQTREYWRDAKSAEFEHKYLLELQANVDNAVTVIDQLEKVLTKIRSECE